MKTNNSIIKSIDLNARVDYDTARCLMLMGMPQGKAVLAGVTASAKEYYEYNKIGHPFYVTIYKMNLIHDYEECLTVGHIHVADKMCYAPTIGEALEYLKNKLLESLSHYSFHRGWDSIDFNMARVLCYLGMPQGKVLSDWKPTKAQVKRYGQPFYVTIYKNRTIHKLVDLNKGHDRDADAMCYAPAEKVALIWIESVLGVDCN